jgi:hypothetical protein
MRSRLPSFLAALLGGPCLAWGETGEASSVSQRFLLEYSAPAGCPTEVTFRSQVRARTSQLEFVARDAPRLSILIAAVEGAYLGRLSIGSAPEEPTTREIEATTCDEVVAALALSTALHVDPSAVDGEPARHAEAEPRWSVAAELALSGVPSSFPTVRSGASLDFVPEPQALTWGARALVAYASGSEGSATRGGIRISLLETRLSFCPLVARFWIEGSLCGFGETGLLAARGQDVDAPRSAQRPWLGGGAELGLRYPARGAWFVGAGTELLVALTRQRFVLEDNSEIYELTRFAGAARVSLGFRLP